MSAALRRRRGYCPSVWKPMPSGDGLIVRFAVPASGLRSSQLRALLQLARTHGSGLIEITRRGKLQLRGVRDEALPVLQRELQQLGLAEDSALVINPLAGLAAGTRPLDALAGAISEALRARREGFLSDKFAVVLDCGGLLRDIRADVLVELDPEGDVATLSVPAATGGGWHELGTCRSHDCPRAVTELANELASFSSVARMRDVVAFSGMAPLEARFAPFACGTAPRAAAEPISGAWIGFHTGSRPWLGLGLPFGSADATSWRALVELAEWFGSAELRFTPQRGVILPDVAAQHVQEVTELARNAGLILDAGDPLLRAIACPGAPACSSAHGPTRDIARSLLPLLAADQTLHVSGCRKGCASSASAAITLVCEPEGARLGSDADVFEVASLPVLTLSEIRSRCAAQAHGGT